MEGRRDSGCNPFDPRRVDGVEGAGARSRTAAASPAGGRPRRRAAHAGCADPFCGGCVPFGRHLDVAAQQRRRAVWARQDRDRAGGRIERLRVAEVGEAAGFLHDLGLLRKTAGLTQGTLAAKVGIQREILSRIERGRVMPRRRVVDRLRAALAPVRTGSGPPRKAG